MTEDKSNFVRADLRLLFAAAVGPLSALTGLCVNDALVPTACEHGSKLLLHGVAGGCFSLALLGLVLGLREYRRIGVTAVTTAGERLRWMSIAAVGLSLASALMIVAMELPNLLLRSCD